MATAAERQHAYRQRHLAEGEAARLNVVIDYSAKAQLSRLARHRGTTQRAVLESLLALAERETLDGLSTGDQAEYYG